VDADLLIFGQAGGVERLSISIDIYNALAELELSRLVRGKGVEN
jgi:hypothetical protein